MNLESNKKLRLDKRLVRRRGWIPEAELDGALEALPDVSDKVAPFEEAPADPAPAADASEGGAPV